MAEICFERNNFFTVISIGILIIGYVISQLYKESKKRTKSDNDNDNRVPKSELKPQQEKNIVIINKMVPNRYPSVSQDVLRITHPLIPPLRRGPYNMSHKGPISSLVNIPTRGEYGPFHQMGFIHNKENPDQAMPLIGRKIHSGKWEYYTFHHLNPNVKIPLKIRGDGELSTDEDIDVSGYGNKFTVNKYDIDHPRYIPY